MVSSRLAIGDLTVDALGALFEHTSAGPVRVATTNSSTRERIVALVRLRDTARRVMAVQTGPPSPGTVAAWDEARTQLHATYDAYLTRWGPVNAFRDSPSGRRTFSVPKRFRDDPGWGLVSALEVFDPASQTAQKAAIFDRWLATPERRFHGADTPAEALAASLVARRHVDVTFIADLLATEPAVALDELAGAGLVYRSHTDPDGWEPAVHLPHRRRQSPTPQRPRARRHRRALPGQRRQRWRQWYRHGYRPRRSRPASARCGSPPATSATSSPTPSAPTST